MQRTVTQIQQQVGLQTSLHVGTSDTSHALDYAQRFSAICSEVYGGSQSAMALDMQTTQPTISRIVNGVQTPNCDLLSAVAAKGNINPYWLLTGVGEMATGTGASLTTTPGCLPISGELLPGPVSESRQVLTGLQFSVPPEFARESCYLYAVPNNMAGQAKFGLNAGDLVLLETVPIWQEHPSIVAGQLLVVRRNQAPPALVHSTAVPKKALEGSATDRPYPSIPTRHIDIDDAPPAKSSRKSGRARRRTVWKVLAVSRLVIRRKPGAAM